ncbi:MAG: phosphoribosylpyrophosphate synthetase [Deltaproteobacteria bacterium]|nr:phosphoribosylpyrophosphate synthetase [Deltaproteobacteria bacterium]
MREAETLSQAIKRLEAKGYTEDFRSKEGKLIATPSQQKFEADDLSMDEVVRFEGETDLDEEMILFALSDPKTGLKGTYAVAYSHNMDPEDVDIVQKLSLKPS